MIVLGTLVYVVERAEAPSRERRRKGNETSILTRKPCEHGRFLYSRVASLHEIVRHLLPNEVHGFVNVHFGESESIRSNVALTLATCVGLGSNGDRFRRRRLRRIEAGTMIVDGGGASRSWPVAIASCVLALEFAELGEVAI